MRRFRLTTVLPMVAGAAVAGTAVAVTLTAPAFALTPGVTGVANCVDGQGSAVITWTLTNIGPTTLTLSDFRSTPPGTLTGSADTVLRPRDRIVITAVVTASDAIDGGVTLAYHFQWADGQQGSETTPPLTIPSRCEVAPPSPEASTPPSSPQPSPPEPSPKPSVQPPSPEASASVLPPPVAYHFTGFFPPVDNPPVVNVAKAGSAVPVKFSLGGNQGLDIFAAGSPSVQQMTCESGTPVDDAEQATSPGDAPLGYDGATDRYTFVWKTARSWAGSCRRLAVTFTDGTARYATFRFT